jgi:hypothetical protein
MLLLKKRGTLGFRRYHNKQNPIKHAAHRHGSDPKRVGATISCQKGPLKTQSWAAFGLTKLGVAPRLLPQ